MTTQEKINKVATAVSQFHKERDFFVAALMSVNTPEEFETLLYDDKWKARRKEVAIRFNKMIGGVLNV